MALEMDEDQSKRLIEWFADCEPETRVSIEGIGAFDLTDIRSIIKQKPAAMQENESYSSEVTEEEKEYAEYLRKVDEWAAFDANSKTFDAWKEEQRKAYKDDADF
jgi:hypothetical protein